MVAIPVIIAILGLTSAVMGAYMSGRRHPVWFAAFIAIGLAGAVLVGLQSWKSSVAQDEMRKEQHETKVAVRAIAQDIARVSVREPEHMATSPETREDIAQDIEAIKRGIVELTASAHRRPWGFTKEQLESFTQKMSKFANGEDRRDLILLHSQSPDSKKLSSDLVESLRAAKWNLPYYGLTKVISGSDVWGIILTFNPNEPNPSGGFSEVKGLLQEAKLPFFEGAESDVPAGRFRIHIGERPID